MARELKPCGTRTAYDRHLRYGEEPCEPCREANAKRRREDDNHRSHARARQRALTRLSHMFPEQFAALLAEEKAAEKTAAEKTAEETPR